MNRCALSVLLVSTLNSIGSAAVVLGHVDNFNDGTVQGWEHGTIHPSQPSNAGNALFVMSTATGTSGSRFLAFNSSSVWTGDYTTAGVTGIELEVLTTDTLNLRVALNGPGGWFATAPIVPVTNTTQTLIFPIAASDLTAVGGAADVGQTLDNVSEIQIFSASTLTAGASGRPVGDRLALSATFDNISAIPEPNGFLLIGLVTLVVLLVRRIC